MKRPALQNKQVGVLRMAFRARRVFGTFEKRALGVDGKDGGLSATSIWQAHFRSIFELFRGLIVDRS